MTITSTDTIVEVTGSISPNLYTFNLPIHKASDLDVYVAGVKKETRLVRVGIAMAEPTDKKKSPA